MSSIEVELWIDASPSEVYPYFTDPARLVAWHAGAADVDVRPGGALRLLIAGDNVARGHYVEVDAPHRLVFTWGWEGNELVPPGSSTVEIDLVENRGGTTVRLRHSDLPAAEADGHGEGWRHYLARLDTAACGTDPGPDPWVGTQTSSEETAT